MRRNYTSNPKSVCKKHVPPADYEKPSASAQDEVYTFVVSEARFSFWLTAFKIRYWYDFGNQDDILVRWQTAKDNGGVSVEHVIKINQVDSERNRESADAGSETVQPLSLFTITLYNTKCKVMIQGSFRDQWIAREFPIFQQLVSALEEGKSIGEAYEKCTNSKTKLTITEEDIDISDSEENNAEPGPTTQKVEPIMESEHKIEDNNSHCVESTPQQSRESNRRASKNSKKLYSHIVSTPVKRKTQKGKPKKSEETKSAAKRDQDLYADLLCKYNDRIINLEDTVAHLENQISTRDMRILELEDEIESLKNESYAKLEDTKANFKHDLTVFKREINDKLKVHSDRIQKIEIEEKQFGNKLNSLRDLQMNISQKASSVENKFISFKEATDTDINDFKSNINESNALHKDQIEEKILLLQNKFDNLSTPTFRSHRSFAGSYGSDPRAQTPRRSSPYKADVVVLMDSNRRFIDKKKLSLPRKSINMIKCGNLQKAKEIISDPRFQEPNAIVVHCGVNDTESKSVQEICSQLVEVVTQACTSFPESKILISHITPRQDEYDQKVKSVNCFLDNDLQDKLPPEANVFVIRHDNLDLECLHDRKHLSRRVGVRRLAGNIKNTLRQALGVESLTRHTDHASGLPPSGNQENSMSQMPYTNEFMPQNSEPQAQMTSVMPQPLMLQQLSSQLHNMSNMMAGLVHSARPMPVRPPLPAPMTPWPHPIRPLQVRPYTNNFPVQAY